ncbi:hypothetical protein AB0M22_45450 [Nocardia sp. NPDC051756]|uniref:hypothetical protein n=1 Tax=Nocardia sp. NPDC051756 TaxID=3154751 RepID=UPI0034495ABE
MSGWAELGLLLAALMLSVIAYCAITYWPQRPPKDGSAQAIRRRNEEDRPE